MLMLLAQKRIHGRIAKSVLEAVFAEDKDPGVIIQEKGWEQITDPAVLGGYIEKVMAAHPAAVASIRGGDSRPTTFLIGEIMRDTSGRADPALVQTLVKQKLAVSVIQILSLGGAIVGATSAQGDVVAGDPAEIDAPPGGRGYALPLHRLRGRRGRQDPFARRSRPTTGRD